MCFIENFNMNNIIQKHAKRPHLFSGSMQLSKRIGFGSKIWTIITFYGFIKNILFPFIYQIHYNSN